jgi:hypothetical protein
MCQSVIGPEQGQTHAEMIFDDMDVFATLMSASLPSLSTFVDNCSAMNRQASLQASLNAISIHSRLDLVSLLTGIQ